LGGHEIEQLETFTLLAELALGLAGFTGVAAAFGGRDRTYAAIERFRLEGIFLTAAGAMVGSLCVLTLTGAGRPTTEAYRWASLVSAPVLLFTLLRIASPSMLALMRDPNSSASPWIHALGTTLIAACLFLLAGNFIAWWDAWPLFAAFSLQLTWGLFLFARLLTQRN
jgi:hypothetical protein